jgi:cytochrome b561
VHYLTFALFVGALAHGVWTGTDTKMPAVQFSYLASGVAVLFLTFFRILAARSVTARARTAPAAAQAKAA